MRQSRRGRGMLPRGSVPFGWPDKSGLISIGLAGQSGSCGSFWRLWQHSPHEQPTTISAGRSSRSSRLWARVRLWLTFSPRSALSQNFGTWLLGVLDGSPYGCARVGEVVAAAGADLGLDPAEVMLLLVRGAREGTAWVMDDGLIRWA